MNALPDDAGIPKENYAPLGRAAIEGIPVGAIARIFAYDYGDTHEVLTYLKTIGTIAEVPRADWPPTAKNDDRLPTFTVRSTPSDLLFNVQRAFKLTKLEAGFLAAMLRCEHADKTMLHGVIEQQRMERSQRPNKQELTDPKMVDVMICKLRKKLVQQGFKDAIKTVWGGGYFIDPETKKLILTAITERIKTAATVDVREEVTEEAIPAGVIPEEAAGTTLH